MTHNTQLLSIEDNPGDAALLVDALHNRGSHEFQVTVAKTVAEGLEKLDDAHYHAILLDLSLPDGHGLEVLERVQEKCPDIPILVLSGSGDEDTALEAVHRGAQDYVVKGLFDAPLLERTIRYAIERHQLAAQLRGELERRDEFLSHVSHELRTPLSAIHQFTHILLDDGLTEDQHDYASVVMRNARQLARMIDDLLEVTRATSGRLTVHPTRIQLGDAIDKTLTNTHKQAKAAGVNFTVQVESGLEVVADANRTSQILFNLLDNALKFTPRGEHIALSASVCSDDPSMVHISVEDTGAGVPADELDSIFERMYQAGSRTPDAGRTGLGLGLHICREIVALHGGRIWAEAGPERGTIFHVTLPRYSVKHSLAALAHQISEGGAALHLLHVDLERDGGFEPRPPSPAAMRACRLLIDEQLADVASVVFPGPEGGAGRGAFAAVFQGTSDTAASFSAALEGLAASDPCIAQGGWRVVVTANDLPSPVDASGTEWAEQLARHVDSLIDQHHSEVH